jgi:hypothetical protein
MKKNFYGICNQLFLNKMQCAFNLNKGTQIMKFADYTSKQGLLSQN